MPSNFWWVFATYGVVWIVVFLYLMRLLSRQRELERELRRLQQQGEDG